MELQDYRTHESGMVPCNVHVERDRRGGGLHTKAPREQSCCLACDEGAVFGRAQWLRISITAAIAAWKKRACTTTRPPTLGTFEPNSSALYFYLVHLISNQEVGSTVIPRP